MSIGKRELNLLSDDGLDVVAGGIRNDPLTTALRMAELRPSIDAAKALMDEHGGVYMGNTATTSGGPLNNPIFF